MGNVAVVNPFAVSSVLLGMTLAAARPQDAAQRGGEENPGRARAYKEQITPHWFHNDTRFWYRNDLRDDRKEFIVVDAERGTREPAFDHARLAEALSKAAGAKYETERLPFGSISVSDDSKAIRFTIGEHVWKCDLESYQCVKDETGTAERSSTPPQ